jgi:predicted DNA-binding antitoxin AbrB/MazE fold protein
MELSIEATYEDGVLKPLKPLPFPEHERLRVTVRPATSRARQTAGLMGWTGGAELAERFAADPELELPPAASQ